MRNIKLPKNWDKGWLEEQVPFDDIDCSDSPIRWFGTETEAKVHAKTLKWWLIQEKFPGLWRVEEMDGYR